MGIPDGIYGIPDSHDVKTILSDLGAGGGNSQLEVIVGVLG
jgi:hypothetical protein